MAIYTVTIHEHVGHEYEVEAVSEDEAIEIASRGYSECGDDGDITYSEVQGIDVAEGKQLGLTEAAAVPVDAHSVELAATLSAFGLDREGT